MPLDSKRLGCVLCFVCEGQEKGLGTYSEGGVCMRPLV